MQATMWAGVSASVHQAHIIITTRRVFITHRHRLCTITPHRFISVITAMHRAIITTATIPMAGTGMVMATGVTADTGVIADWLL